MMSKACAQCGARLPEEQSCRELFERCLVKEFEDSSYSQVHHLTVPAFMLQHNGYSREGWLAARELLRQFLCEGLTPTRARNLYRSQVISQKRTSSLTRGPKLSGFASIIWTRTIATIRFDSAARYCSDVQDWAASIVEDTERLIISLGTRR